jgi:hypothetical protein
MFANIQNYQITIIKIITYLQFDKLQVRIFKFTSLHLYAKLSNYQITKITKLQIASAFLHIYKFANACMFSYLHVLQNYKFINFQFAWFASLKPQNYK